MNRRQFSLATLALIPSLYSAAAQPKPPAPAAQKAPTRTPRPQPTLTPVVIDAMSESDYRSHLSDDLSAIMDAIDAVATMAMEAIKAPAKANTKRWVDDYVAQALTASNTATSLFIIDPPENLAMAHVYILRYGNAVHEAVDKFNDAVTNTDASVLLKAQSSKDYALGELRKALGLLRQS